LDRPHRGFHGCARSQAIVDNENLPALQVQEGREVELFTVFTKPPLFFVDDKLELILADAILFENVVIQEHHIWLRQSADGKFPELGMSDFANDDYIQRAPEQNGNLFGHDHATAGQAENDLRPDVLFDQELG
jgi:hypothetical protein